MLSTGDTAPDFTLPDQHNNPVTLSEQEGELIALYFYPAASTPGCTTQACQVRDNRLQLQQVGVTVIGVSADLQPAVAEFAEQYQLTFPLLADSDASVCESYGVWGGRWASRTTFLLNSSRLILEVIDGVTPDTSASQLLEACRRHSGA